MAKYFLAVFILFALWGCESKPLKSIKEEINSSVAHNYLYQVKPIFDRRCVVCHSCYNAPCQLKLSSYEGTMRGGSKIVVYDGERLSAIAPTRLFIDANSTKMWHHKGFFSVTNNSAGQGYDNAIMLELLHQKQKHPTISGQYNYEPANYSCPKNIQELSEFVDENPASGMPFGLPQLTHEEFKTLEGWMEDGSPGPSADEQLRLTTPSDTLLPVITAYEAFLNTKDAKHQMSARYIYEHLYLGHINFEASPKEYFELVRSYTPSGKPIEVVNTVLPFGKPEKRAFYYRFRKIHSTLVKKTHMLYTMTHDKLKRYRSLFIESKWREVPHVMDYELKTSANPFMTYKQIPARSRYEFLLDDVLFFIRTFIRGPVCDGQVALDVIEDHFWVTFMDPSHDLSVVYETFLDSHKTSHFPMN